MEGGKKMRMTRNEYYLVVLEAVRKRSTCDRGKSGAILVKNGRLISTGYVGAPVGMPHCDEVGHLIELRHMERPYTKESQRHCIRTVHAELNAILQAARFGISIEGAVMYCTMVPCYECAKAIVNVGLSRVIAVYPYQSQERTISLFKSRKILFTILEPDSLPIYKEKPDETDL
jgi:dCMP deaminase